MAEALSSQHTNTFPDFLAQTGISILVSTYQAGKLILLRYQDGGLNTHFIDMPKPMGIALQDAHLAVGTGFQLSHYYNMADVAAKIEPFNTFNACYVPRETHITGDIDIHEMGFTDDKELWLVNTRMSCLCTISAEYSVVPRWRPPFISAYDLSDRCHLNGLAMKDGQPTYVSALGTSDSAAGWRKDKAHGGMLMDIRDNRMVASGLSMPHSPRWYQGKLWVLESGAGSLATVDIETGELTTIVELPGFTRGIDFYGKYAFIGLSQVRETAVFAGLPLTERCQERQCGIYIVDIEAQQVLGFVVFSGEVQEIFSVQILPASLPVIMEMEDPLLRSTYSIPEESLKAFSAPDPAQKALEQANVFYSRRQFDDAIQAYTDLLKEHPKNAIARHNLGLTYLESKQWQLAVDTFQIIVDSEKNADAQLSLGKAYAGLRNWQASLLAFNQAIEIDLQFAEAYYQRSLVLLHQGDYQKAWQDFEWRIKMQGFSSLDCKQAQWQGEDISDKTLLVHSEPKLADNIQFARFLPQLAKRCARLVVLCPDVLRLFFKGVEGVDEVRLAEQGLDDFDVFLGLLSSPALLDTTLQNLPANTPYWKVPQEVVVTTLDKAKNVKIGLSWRADGASQEKADSNQELQDFLSLVTTEQHQVYSFQASLNKAEKASLKEANVTRLDNEMLSIAHIGALIKQMDLVICVDNATAHIAASLGKPCYLLLDKNASWLWQEEGAESAWYPSVRLFCQGEESWDLLLKKVKDDLIKQ